MSNDLQADLAADLRKDLDRPPVLPSAPAPLPLPSAPAPSATPAMTLTLTPLRWSSPRFDATERGIGLAVRVGPLRVEVGL